MQKIITIIAITIFSVVQIKAQENETINLLTSGKWYAEYFIVDGQKIEYSPEVQKKTWMLFNDNDTIDYMINGKLLKANWEYNTSNNLIKFFKEDETQEYKIISITENKMLVEELGEEKSIIGWKK